MRRDRLAAFVGANACALVCAGGGACATIAIAVAVAAAAAAETHPDKTTHASPVARWEIAPALGWPGGAAPLAQAGPWAGAGRASGGNVGATRFALAAGIGRTWGPRFELFANPSFGLATASNTVVFAGITAGPAFNFGADSLADAAFVYLAPGFALISGGGATSVSLRIAAGGGKRFSLAHGVSFAPLVGYVADAADGGSGALELVPLRFAILL